MISNIIISTIIVIGALKRERERNMCIYIYIYVYIYIYIYGERERERCMQTFSGSPGRADRAGRRRGPDRGPGARGGPEMSYYYYHH